jgi:hypothetical protein
MNDGIKTAQLEETISAICESTRIVRYMKLETLLLMLIRGWVFIPSHESLRGLDPLEGELLFSMKSAPQFWSQHSDRMNQHNGTFRCERYYRDTGKNPELDPYQEVRYPGDPYENVGACFRQWLDALAAERCVWCWNRFENHSNALWELYAKRGVAVQSTVGQVKDALVAAGVIRGLVSPVEYLDRKADSLPNVLRNETNIFCPHLFKDVTFDYEKEVRFVLGANHEVLREKRGVLIRINPTSFINDFELSPRLQQEEQSAAHDLIEDLIKNARSATEHGQPLEQ